MPVQFETFTTVATVPLETIAQYRDRVEPAVIELWETQGFGIGANGFLKVIDPDRYITMIGEFFPRHDMVPVLATAMGDIVVYYEEKYRILQYRYARVAGMSSSLRHLGTTSQSDSYLDRIFAYAPYAEAAAAYGALTRPEDFDEIYAYKLPLPAGGPEGVEYLTRSRIFEHIAFTTQLAGPIPFAG